MESSLIISCGSLAITLGGIIYYAGALPEKLKNLAHMIDKIEALNREQNKSIQEQFMTTVQRLHNRFDELQHRIVNDDGQTMFVTRHECNERNANMTLRYSQGHEIFCKLLSDLQKEMKSATEERNKQIELLRGMSERLARIEGKS
jgi:hypothetical protein